MKFDPTKSTAFLRSFPCLFFGNTHKTIIKTKFNGY